MDVRFSPTEARVIGCLMEKSVITPDQYPLSLNALVNACNQKSSREPVLSLDPGVVQRTVNEFVDPADVDAALESLMSRTDGPFVARLPREPRRKDHAYAHLFGGPIESA